MNLYPRGINQIESGETIGNSLLKLIEDNLDIKSWGFNLAFTKFNKINNIIAIYNSEWCRLSFMFSYMRSPMEDELSIEYGRLHAPNEEPFILWNGEECRCWHNISVPLRFLDGLTPVEAYKQVKVDKKLPIIVRNFQESVLGKKLLKEYPPRFSIALQAALWEHYGKRLFELFDLRRPELWNDYRRFNIEYYKLLEMNAIFGPPFESIC